MSPPGSSNSRLQPDLAPGPSVKRYLVVTYFIEVGLILVLVPWSTLWERNYFAEAIPLLQAVVWNPACRGAITGLGLVSLVAGLIDLVSLVSTRHR